MAPKFCIVEYTPIYDAYDGVRGWRGKALDYVCHTLAFARRRAASVAGEDDLCYRVVWREGRPEPSEIKPVTVDADEDFPW